MPVQFWKTGKGHSKLARGQNSVEESKAGEKRKGERQRK